MSHLRAGASRTRGLHSSCKRQQAKCKNANLRRQIYGSCAYVGAYKADEPAFSAELTVTQHRHVPGAVSALGLKDVLAQLHGLLDADSGAVPVQGSSSESSAVCFAARLTLSPTEGTPVVLSTTRI